MQGMKNLNSNEKKILFTLFTDILQTDLHTIEPIHSDGKIHYVTTLVLMIVS